MKFKKTLSAGVLSLGLVVGLAGFAGATSGTIGTTGPDSSNKITSESRTRVTTDNDNNIHLSSHNTQDARSGRVEVMRNTHSGHATSGDSDNSNSVDATVQVNNRSTAADSASMGTGTQNNTGSINNTGPDSLNEVKFKNTVDMNVSNDNNVTICNTNDQSASSGSVEVTRNTTGGSATSGSVSNTNSSTFAVRVTN